MSTKNAPNEENEDFMAVKVPFKTSLLYGIGFLGSALFTGIQTNATAWFWYNLMGLDAFVYSFIMVVIYNIWNAINDPIFGYLSDRTRSRWGRRIPWIRFFSPVWLVSGIFLFFPFLSFGELGLAIWFTAFICIFDLCFSIVIGCLNSLLPEFTTLTSERTKVNLISTILGFVGTAISFILPLLLKGNVIQFFIFVIIADIIAFTLIFIPSLILKERRECFENVKSLGFKKAVVESLKNRTFLSFLGWNFMVQFASAILMANIFFYATYILKATAEDPASYLLFISLLIPLIPGFFIWSKLGKKRGIKQVVMICSLFSATGLLLLFLAPDLTFSMISLAVVGAGLSGLMMFGNVMIAESTDFDELRTKQRREAMFFATNALFTKPAIGLAEGALAITLTLTGFIKEEIDEITGETIIFDQPLSALWGIKMVMGLFPAIALYTSIFFIYFYPNLKRTQKMKQALSILHKEKNFK